MIIDINFFIYYLMIKVTILISKLLVITQTS
jgi:hypothetical protein